MAGFVLKKAVFSLLPLIFPLQVLAEKTFTTRGHAEDFSHTFPPAFVGCWQTR